MEKDTLIESDFLNMDYEFVEYYVGMARMVVYWHVQALGFKVLAYSGPENGDPSRCSYYIAKNDIRLVITAAAHPGAHEIASFVHMHGNGIKRIGVRVRNVEEFFGNAVGNGAIPVRFPDAVSDEEGTVRMAAIKIFDDNEIVFINNDDYEGIFMPGYKDIAGEWDFNHEDSCFNGIDHIASALRMNEVKIWERYFNNIFRSKTVASIGERDQAEEQRVGMLMKVLQTEGRQINTVLVEPDQKEHTQIQQFLDKNCGSGIQHIAFSSSNIFRTVEVLRKNGVRFSSYPDAYYQNLKMKHPSLDVDRLQEYGILCDVVDDALLFQIFTKPICDRPTFFYEIIQRVNNYQGFGADNIRALFQAVEKEMSLQNA